VRYREHASNTRRTAAIAQLGARVITLARRTQQHGTATEESEQINSVDEKFTLKSLAQNVFLVQQLQLLRFKWPPPATLKLLMKPFEYHQKSRVA
jgi:type II secretory pathway component PulJ